MACIHHRRDLAAHIRARGARLAQHIAGGKLHHAPFIHQTLGLRAFASTGRSKKDDVGHSSAFLRGST